MALTYQGDAGLLGDFADGLGGDVVFAGDFHDLANLGFVHNQHHSNAHVPGTVSFVVVDIAEFLKSEHGGMRGKWMIDDCATGYFFEDALEVAGKAAAGIVYNGFGMNAGFSFFIASDHVKHAGVVNARGREHDLPPCMSVVELFAVPVVAVSF